MLGVIVLFGLVYALLFLVWLRLLNQLIQRGPEDSANDGRTESASSVLDTASQRTAAHDNVLGSAKHITVGGG